jgi:hypothetical protein
MKIITDMSHRLRDAPRPFQTSVAQRDIEAEVAHCVGGVSTRLPPNFETFLTSNSTLLRAVQHVGDALAALHPDRLLRPEWIATGADLADIALDAALDRR